MKLPLYDFADSRRIDILSQEAGFSNVQLMGQAALSSLYHLPKYRRILILCGPGNNGGDGFALAYMLASSGLLSAKPECMVFSVSELKNIKSPTSRFYAEYLVEKLGIGLRPVQDFLNIKLGGQDLIVEALLGTGQRALLKGQILDALLYIKKLRCRSISSYGYPLLISLDLPAGLSEGAPCRFLPPGVDLPKIETPESNIVLAAPDEIHCYGVDKLAIRLSPSLNSYAKIRLLPIGLSPPSTYKTIENRYKYTAKNIWRFQMPSKGSLKYLDIEPSYIYKNPESHKYESGHGLIIGGSYGMEGALLMAAKNFFASGGGILHVITTEPKTRMAFSQALPTVMFHDIDFPPKNIRPKAVLVGPGLAKTQLEEITIILKEMLEHDPYLILDASATGLISEMDSNRQKVRAKTILLPHTGEWKALGGQAITDSESLYSNLNFYNDNLKCHVLVKDSISVLFSPYHQKSVGRGDTMKNGETLVLSEPNAALSVAGSGDCLGGILLALLARKHASGFTHTKLEDTLDEVQAKIAAAYVILHKAVEGHLHPRSDQFADFIENLLKNARQSIP